MPDNEAIISRIERMLGEIVTLGGSQERTGIIPNLVVLDNAPTGLSAYVIVADNRDNDAIPALKVPGVEYAINDLVNVLFIEGTEPIAFQQGSGSPSSNSLWQVISGSSDIYYNAGNVQIGAATTPATELEVSGDITLADDIIHKGDADTLISLETNQIVVQAGGTTITLDSAGDQTNYADLILGDNQRGNAFANWYDYLLIDATEGSQFNDNDASYPAGWTENDAAATTNTNQIYGFWYFRGTSAEVSWDYYKQSGMDADNDSRSQITFGPIMFRDGTFTADVDYYFGLYRDNAGTIDTTTYNRVHLQWDSATPQWRLRGEAHDGTTPTVSSWVTLNYPAIMPLWVRAWFTPSGANIVLRTYFSFVKTGIVHTLLQQLNIAKASVTWGDVWVRINQTRGAGIEDFLLVGGIDKDTEP